jgi:hypothetical protein
MDNLRSGRSETCREWLAFLDPQEKTRIERFPTGGENWFPLEFHHSRNGGCRETMLLERFGNCKSRYKMSCGSLFRESIDFTLSI